MIRFPDSPLSATRPPLPAARTPPRPVCATISCGARLCAAICLAAAVCLGLPDRTGAQDSVWLQRPEALGRVRVSGFIEDYTGRELIIRSLSGEAVNRYPVNEVLEIKTPQVSAHAEGLRQMAAGRIEPAVQQFEDALKQEDRVWVRREILALLVRCALRQGNYVTAGTRFELLYESDPTTAHFKLIPLKWSPGEISDETRIGAQVAMAREPEVSRLIGASLLLDVPRLTRGAELVLKELATSSDARIQSLAQVQGWRLPIAAGPVANVQLNLWQKRVDALPSDLRGGPAYLLGRAYRGRREHELAAASLLWLPLVDDHDYNLAARACLEAGESLGAIGQEAEADVLYAEVVRRYPDSPFAAEARTLLDRRTQPRAGSRSEDGESAQDEPTVIEKN